MSPESNQLSGVFHLGVCIGRELVLGIGVASVVAASTTNQKRLRRRGVSRTANPPVSGVATWNPRCRDPKPSNRRLQKVVTMRSWRIPAKNPRIAPTAINVVSSS